MAEESPRVEGLVFDVQRFSLHDGPGIRTTVFFKGCSLRCRWCQNPESLRPVPELMFSSSRCLPDCRLCESVCPRDALAPWSTTPIDWDRCDHCGQCPAVCPSGALRMVGRYYSPEELAELCLADRSYFVSSGGGVTLSGGEPVLQSPFLQALLPLLKQQGVHILLQTAGHYARRMLEPLLPFLDAVYFDLKAGNDAGYRQWTGGDAAHVLDNLAWLAGQAANLTVRMPIVPGMNSDRSTLAAVAQQLRTVGFGEITLLPYHALWEAKLAGLCTAQAPLNLAAEPDRDEIMGTLQAHGIASTWG